MSDLLDMKIGDLPKQREIPEGFYRAVVTKAKHGEATSGTPFAELTFKLTAPLGEQDLTGVDLKRAQPKKSWWLTENAIKMVSDDLPKFNKTLNSSLSIREAFDELVGAEVGVNVVNEENKDKRYLVVKSVRKLRD